MPNAFVSFAEVKVRVTFEMLLAHYGLQDGFTRKGDALAGPCPICQSAGKRPFSVNLRKNAWYCFAKCQGGGNILDFVSRKEGVEIRRAAELLDRWFGLGLGAGPPPTEARASPETRRTAPAPPVPAANPPLTFALKQLDPAHPGFAAYGLSEATARAFEAGHCARGMLRDYLAIPVRNRVGELVAYVGLDPDPAAPERYKLPPTFHPELEVWNLYRAAPAEGEPFFLAGEIVDALQLAEQGLANALSLFSADLSPAQEELLRETFPEGTRMTLVSRGSALEAIVPRLARHFAVRLLVLDEAECFLPPEVTAR